MNNYKLEKYKFQWLRLGVLLLTKDLHPSHLELLIGWWGPPIAGWTAVLATRVLEASPDPDSHCRCLLVSILQEASMLRPPLSAVFPKASGCGSLHRKQTDVRSTIQEPSVKAH